jgi:hypothetical protein
MIADTKKAFKVLINSKELYESCAPRPDGTVRIHDSQPDGSSYEIVIRKVEP